LTPREEDEYSFILLEIDEKSWLIRKAIFLDWAGNKTEFRFSRIRANVRVPLSFFELNVPPDVEIIEKLKKP
jgi:outer membrane lipoprotein-sorting protein